LKENPEKNARKICELVAKMFRKYPPSGPCCRHLSRAIEAFPIEQSGKEQRGDYSG